MIDFDDATISHENDDTNIQENELNCLEFFHQSRSIKVPVPDLMHSSTTTDSSHSDENLVLYPNPLYESDHSSIDSPPTLTHRDPFPPSKKFLDSKTLPRLEKAPRWESQNSQAQAPCGASKSNQNQREKQISGIQTTFNSKGRRKAFFIHIFFLFILKFLFTGDQ